MIDARGRAPTREDFIMHDKAAGMPAEAPVIRTIAMPADTNPAGDIFGGWLMSQMDLAAGNLAARVARGRCATVRAEAMVFLSPVFVGDEVSLFARLMSRGRTSLKIEVEAWRRARDSEETTKVTEAVFVYVAIDANRMPRPLPEDPVIASRDQAETVAGASASSGK
jgi:acyl-CoA thioesterase YciA